MSDYFIMFVISFVLAMGLLALNIADIATTNQFLKQHKAYEGGKVSLWLQAHWGKWWWTPKIALCLILVAGIVCFYFLVPQEGNEKFMGLTHSYWAKVVWLGIIVGLFYVNVFYWQVVQQNVEVDRGDPQY